MPTTDDNPEARAMRLFRQGRVRAAMAVLTVGVCRDSEASRLWLMRAIVNHSQAQWEAALADIETAMTLAPLPPGGQLVLGDCYAFTGKKQLGLLAYQHLLESGPTSSKVCAGLYRGFQKCGRPDLAIEACQEALRIDPTDHAALLAMAHSMVSTGHPAERVAEVLQSAVHIAPSNETYRVSLAIQYVRCQRDSEAYEQLCRASIHCLAKLTCRCSVRRLMQLCGKQDDLERCEALCRSLSRIDYYAKENLSQSGEEQDGQ